ncbi:ABC transporter substrate-binding protein [Devosia epidermidihirudinis]|nr:ABC transporter substrate-binding protein [Devosia epidermidihirudinis]
MSRQLLPLSLSRRHLLLGAVAAGVALAMPAYAQEAREVEHALGKAIITKKPTRVLVLSDFTDLEYVLALGVTPVGYGFTGSWGRGGLPWQSAAADVPQLPLVDTVASPEVVAGFEPDLIIGMKTYIERVQSQLEGIAPVIALDWSTPWRNGLRLVASALFEDERVEAAIAETEALMADTARSLDGLGGKKIMVGSMYGETLYVIGAGPMATQFAELGLTFVPAPNASDSGLAEYSMENVDILQQADILMSFTNDAEGTERLETFAPFQRLPAVAGNAYIPLGTLTGTAFADNFSPLSAKWVLPRLAALLTDAAAGKAAR